MRRPPAQLVAWREVVAPGQTDAVTPTQGAQIAALVGLPVPVQGRLNLGVAIDTPGAGDAQAQSIAVRTLAGVDGGFQTAIGQILQHLEQHLVFVAQGIGLEAAALHAILLELDIGVDVIAESPGGAHLGALFDQTAIVAAFPADLDAVGGALGLFGGLAQQLPLDDLRRLVTRRRQRRGLGVAGMAEALQHLHALRRIQIAGRQQLFQLAAILPTQDLLQLLVLAHLQATALGPGQPFALEAVVVVLAEGVEPLIEPELQHARRAILPGTHLGQGRLGTAQAGEQAQVGGIALGGGRHLVVGQVRRDRLAQPQRCVLMAGGVQGIGVGGLHQPVLGMGVQVAAIPAERLFRLAQQHQAAAEGQPEHVAVPGPALPVAQQGGQFGLAILVDEQPQ